jgi:hypothetical protein
MKMELVCASRISVYFYQTRWHHEKIVLFTMNTARIFSREGGRGGRLTG